MHQTDKISLIRTIDQKDIILEELRKQGCRITKQRKMIVDAILRYECSCCKEIYAEIVKEDPTIGIATVYRMINALEEIGVIDRRNMYKISCPCPYPDAGVCEVVLNNEEIIRLSREQLLQIIRRGLSVSEDFQDKEVTSVMLR